MTMLDTRVVLAVRNLPASTKFYMEVLGFQREFGDGSDGWSFLIRDRFKVSLGECPEVIPASDTGDHSYVAYIYVDNIDDLHTEIARLGAGERVSSPENKPWGMREFCLNTPDGHRIMFGQGSD